MLIKDLTERIKSGEVSALELAENYIKNIKEKKRLNAVVEVFEQDALRKALECDALAKEGKASGGLFGIPFIIKDNIFIKGKKCAAASEILKDFIAPYDADVTAGLKKEGAVILGRADMDEFGAGGACAVSVAENLCAAAIDTDSCGNILTSAAARGIAGIRPAFGSVSRYGVIPYSSSFDTAGVLVKNAADCAYVLNLISGKRENDPATSHRSPRPTPHASRFQIGALNGINNSFTEKLKGNGYQITEVNIKHLKEARAAYYFIAAAEGASNLSRIDGIKYGAMSGKPKNYKEIYTKSRTEGFGFEIKKNIILGDYAVTHGYYELSKNIQYSIIGDFNKAFESCGIILLPASLPLLPSLSGLPCLSVNGLQIIGRDEQTVFSFVEML